MMLRRTTFVIALACSLPVFADEDALLTEARSVATSIPPKLVKVLAEEIAKGGPESAIGVCRKKAPAMARAASKRTGWAIRRVSLKNRNPKAAPDAWERAVLEDFDRRAAAGERPVTLEKGETVTDDGHKVYRYMKALPTQELCLQCHGPSDKISPAVEATLKKLYPDDKATGFSVGSIRGAITMSKPLLE
jgi:Protein of unknown function (DUF3365)